MKKTTAGVIAAGVALTLVGAPSWALNVGDRAPALKISEWVKGDKVDLAQDAFKRVHVIEFWATWCPPCKISVPLLTELQKKYGKDVNIIGVTVLDERNSRKDVRDFVKEQGEAMGYAVAIDDGDKTNVAYMEAAGAVGIPHAFVVGKDGRVFWQGSPLDPELDRILGQVIAGTYDIDTALKQAQIGEELNRRFQEVYMHTELEQWSRVWDALVGILKLDPSNLEALDWMMQVYISGKKNRDDFRQWVRTHIAGHREDVTAMRNLARVLCSDTDFATRLPDLALEAAKAAYDAGKGKDVIAESTYALALYQIAQLDKAIEVQRAALEVATGPLREPAEEALNFYLQCKQLQQSVQ